MPKKKAFQWSKEEYSMREFVDIFSYRLPLIVFVVVGWMGRDDDHTFSGDEVYRIAAVKRQRRIVTKHPSGYFVSIPTTIKKKVDMYFPDGKVKKSANMSDVVRALRIHENGTLQMMFENDEKVSFSFGPDEGAEINFGKMKVIDVYDERYLVGHSVCEGKVYSSVLPRPIPVYMTIQLAPAVGLVGGTEEDFRKVLADIEEQMIDGTTQVDDCDEIMLFPHDISGSDYEYIRPCSSMSAIIQGSKSETNLPGMTPSSAYGARKEPSPADLFSRLKPSNARKPPAPAPGRVYKAPPPKPNTSGRQTQGHTTKTAPRNKESRKQLPPEPSPTVNLAATETNDDEYVSNLKPDTTRNNKLRLKEFETMSDVPSDISTLTQSQLVKCMRMLKISEPCVCSFVEQGVDGSLLTSLDESILAEEFNFSRFDAIKLMRFAKDGYRPNVK